MTCTYYFLASNYLILQQNINEYNLNGFSDK